MSTADPTRAAVLGTSGLSRSEAAIRLAAEGPNRLPAPIRPSAARRLGGQLVHFFALMLWVAGGLAIVADLAELGIAIFVVILVNAAFSFLQERRADHAAARLQDLLPHRVYVIRDGDVVEIDAGEVVRGDAMKLAPGDRVAADATVTTSYGLRVNTAMLTGESESVAVPAGERVLAGTFVVDGEAETEVDATGTRTRLASIAALTVATPKSVSPLTTELHRVVRTIAIVAVGVGASFLGLSALLGTSLSDATIFAIGVTVALVPEGLLPTVTLSLAIGAQRMAARNALVRRLDAVETLGSTTFICTDKTGTLTRNEMVAVEVWTSSGSTEIHGPGYGPQAVVSPAPSPETIRLARLAARCSTGRAVAASDGTWTAQGDPMEAAIDALARRLGIAIDDERRVLAERWRIPFDSQRKRMTVALADGTLVMKGAVESVLARGAAAPDEVVLAAVADFAARGLRVLAVAAAAVPDEGPDGEPGVEYGLLGLVAFEDPPRPHVNEALAACRRAGIKVAMLTGDHPATAAAIAHQVGLALPGAPVLVAADLPADDELLAAVVDCDGAVIARVTPEDKLRIARALRRRGHVLAMTGDGVNDGPALHEADIGIAMGRSGTDVAREAADLVLLDDDFATIVAAIEQGRATFLNVRRFLTYHLTDNVAELTPFLVWALSGGRFPLALSVMQILALDIGTDTASASALGAEAPTPDVLERPPVGGRLLDRTVAIRAFGVLGPTEAAFEMAVFVAVFLAAGWRPGEPFPTGPTLLAASGAAFMSVVFAQKANAWACRSVTRPPWELGWLTNRLLVVTASCELAFAFVVLLLPAMANRLEHSTPPAWAWVIIVTSAVAVVVVDATWKRLRGRAGAPGS